MAINYEFERHIQAANEAGNKRAVEALRAQQQIFNELKTAQVVFELPREGQTEEGLSQPPQMLESTLPSEQVPEQGMDLKRLGKVLRRQRRGLDISVAALAREAGVSTGTIWILERGENYQTRKPAQPSREMLERIVEPLSFGPEQQQALFTLAGYAGDSQNLTTENTATAEIPNKNNE